MKAKSGIYNFLLWGVFCSFLIITLSGKAHSETIVNSQIIADTTWAKAGSPYIVTIQLDVYPGVTLTIEPGVVVKFNTGTDLEIYGELIAIGTEADMVVFTSAKISPSAGDWGGIIFNEDSADTNMDINGNYISGNNLSYCEISYGNGLITPNALYISYCLIIYNDGIGIQNYGQSVIKNTSILNNGKLKNYAWKNKGGGIFNAGKNSVINNNTIKSNYALSLSLQGGQVKGYGAGIYNEASSVIILNNIITENEAGNQKIRYDVGYGGGIYNSGDDVIIANNTLSNNLAGGTKGAGIYNLGRNLKFENNIMDNNYGTQIYLEAGINSKIRYNKIQGNRVAGSGIVNLGGGATLIENNKLIENGISTYGSMCVVAENEISFGGLGIQCNTFLIIRNRITDSYGEGIWAQFGAKPDSIISGNEISNSKKVGLRINSSAAAITGNIFRENDTGIFMTHSDCSVYGNDIIDNTHDGISTDSIIYFTHNNIYNNARYDFVLNSSLTQQASNNYWGTTNRSEIMSKIYDYWDDMTLGEVIFEPFARTPFLIDSDNDGLPDDIENNSCTDPFNADSDYDGIEDGVEDANHNGTFDSGETNPCNRDTDGDGLNDGVEDANQNGIVDSGETNPRNRDTDGDGMQDGWEVQYSLNPLVDDASEDADGDGYTNIEEYRGRSDPTDRNSLPKPMAMPWIPLLLSDD